MGPPTPVYSVSQKSDLYFCFQTWVNFSGKMGKIMSETAFQIFAYSFKAQVVLKIKPC